jgi:DNA-binding beta-propeller fold protein YncE
MKMSIKATKIAVCILAFAFIASCGPSKAYIDYSAAGGIIWPGPPERPRIKYLWSLQSVSGAETRGKFLEFLVGESGGGLSDPKNADMLLGPHGLFVDGKERLYIADPEAGRLNVVDLKTMDSFYFYETGDVELVSPIGVVADPEGKIYVTDSQLEKVAVFNEKGKFLHFFRGRLKRPTGIAIDVKKRTIYVTDTLEHKIFIYGYDGQMTGSIGKRGEGRGEFNYPTHIAVGPDGYLYVSDTMNARVQIFDPEGGFVTEFGNLGDSFDTFDKTKGIAVDKESHIYIVDSARDMVKIYDRQGRLLLFFGSKGQGYGEFYLPTGIYIDGKDRIFLSDSINMRVQVFQFLGSN